MARLLPHTCLVLLVFVASSVLAQDSLVRTKDLRFRSSLEKANYTAYLKDKDPKRLVALLLDVRDTTTAAYAKYVTREINALVNTLKLNGIDKKKPRKKVQDVHEYVHKTILKNYELAARFDEIFVNGTYNCATATALYAIIFDGLNVPYEIKEKPTHVYLVAYPNAENVLVETTLPLLTFTAWDAKFQQDFLQTMMTLKLVSDEDLKTKSTTELFNKYYFTDLKINLEQLVGIHYVNDAIFRADAQDVVGSYEQIQKAWALFPVHKTEFLLKTYGMMVVAYAKLTPQQKCLYIAEISRLKNLGITNDMIEGEFHNLSIDILNRNNNKSLYQECYNILISNIDDKDLKNNISFQHNYEFGRIQYNQGNLSRAKTYFRNALLLQPNNIDLNVILINTIVEANRRVRDFYAVRDTLHIYQNLFPSLMEYKKFKAALGLAALQAEGDYFEENHPDDALKCFQEFETFASEITEFGNVDDLIAQSCLRGVDYYRKKKDLKKARDLVTKTLPYAPRNSALLEESQRLGK